KAAVQAARSVGYTGAGTVEFIVDGENPDEFYFMEMNTRLQVEHPVTEMITGLDLVEWQLRVAAGEPLPRRQADLAIRGHAIETRIYAEDPDRGFLPSTGRIAYLAAPPESPTVRIDTGVRAGDEISRFYDPMLAKLIVWGEDRAEALRRLGVALARYRVVGVATNVALLQRLVAHPAFADARLDTGLIARHQHELFPPPSPPSPQTLALAALAEVERLRASSAAAAAASPDPHSPWHSIAGWWLNSDAHGVGFTFAAHDADYAVNVRSDGAGWRVEALGRTMQAADHSGALPAVTIDGVRCAGEVVALGDERYVFREGRNFRLRLVDPLAHAADEPDQGGHLTAPMSGTIISVLVKPGDSVTRGAPLLVLEAMKMEHTIAAPADGQVSAVHFAEGDQVREGADLIDVDATGSSPA
ncbi:MAG TPA: biotin/lipoyl-containing protein, partial [Casimicrobiaceae bacterium]|nr:biotin/lipoyl-containing protein [Casimicrobiaceae bacterium]